MDTLSLKIFLCLWLYVYMCILNNTLPVHLLGYKPEISTNDYHKNYVHQVCRICNKDVDLQELAEPKYQNV